MTRDGVFDHGFPSKVPDSSLPATLSTWTTASLAEKDAMRTEYSYKYAGPGKDECEAT